MNKQYRIFDINDIAAVPAEHLDELLEDIRVYHKHVTELSAIADSCGIGLDQTCIGFTFTPDGKHETTINMTVVADVTETTGRES